MVVFIGSPTQEKKNKPIYVARKETTRLKFHTTLKIDVH